MQPRSGDTGSRPIGLNAGSFLAGLFTLLLVFVPFPSAADTEPNTASLQPGKTATAEMAAGTSLSFELHLETGKSYLAEIDQGGFDLQVELLTPAGHSQQFNSPLFRDETERILIEPADSGIHVLNLSTSEFSGAIARPTVTLSVTSADNGILQLISKSSAAYARGNWEDTHKLLARCVGERPGSLDARLLAYCTFALASLEYWQTSDWGRGIELAGQAAVLYRELELPGLEASATQLRAAVIIEKAFEIEKTPSSGLAPEAQELFDEALILFRQSREIHRKSGNSFEVARGTNWIGFTYFYMGDYDRATPYYREAAAEFRRLREWREEHVPLNNLAIIDFDRGYLVRASESFQRIVDILPPDARKDRGDTFDNLGAAQLALGRLVEALESYSRAYSLHQQEGTATDLGRSLSGVGFTYQAIGDTDKALDYLESALVLRREANDGRGIMFTQSAIGTIQRGNGDYDAALIAHRDALKLAASPIDKARAYVEIARDLVAMENSSAALEALAEVSRFAETTQNPKLSATALLISGEAFLMAGSHAEALENFRLAADSYHELELFAEYSRALYGAARTLHHSGRLAEAANQARQAIAAIENLRSQLLAPEMRAYFLAGRQEYYALLIATLLAQHNASENEGAPYIREALAVSESRRARALLDLINETTLSAPRNNSAQRDNLYAALAEARYRLDLALEDQESPQRELRLSGIRQQLAETENQLNLLDIEYRNQNAAFNELTHPSILDAAGMQAMLDTDTALLQYVLGAEQSFVFLVSPEAIQAWPLVGRSVMESRARSLYAQLENPRMTAADRESLDKAVAEFSAMILPPDQGIRQRRLLVVADGVLQYLPFTVMKEQAGDNAGKPLISAHQVVHVPSLSALATQRLVRRERPPASRQVALFADPVFNLADKRFKALDQTATSNAPDPAPLDLVAFGNPANLDRLPSTAFEAKTIAGLVDPGSLLMATGFAATRQAVMQDRLSDFRVIHFATHGLVDSRYPELSALAFSQVDEQGEAINGMLRLHDIYGLELNADLVTMSACRTALGRHVSGEGLSGLTQGLMYAGSHAVLASLWQVPDRATAELMTRFYTNLFSRGQKAPEALRKAQLELSSQARWRHPYFWSAFILQGNWE